MSSIAKKIIRILPQAVICKQIRIASVRLYSHTVGDWKRKPPLLTNEEVFKAMVFGGTKLKESLFKEMSTPSTPFRSSFLGKIFTPCSDLLMTFVTGIPGLAYITSEAIEYYRRKRVEKQRKNLDFALYDYDENPEKWAEFCVDIFCAFEAQIMNISIDGCREIALKEFASDAASRTINYLKENKTNDLEECFLLGKSNQQLEVEFSFGDQSMKTNSESIIHKTGLMIGGKCYVKDWSEPTIYGFRKPFAGDNPKEQGYNEVVEAPIEPYIYRMNPLKKQAAIDAVLDNTKSEKALLKEIRDALKK